MSQKLKPRNYKPKRVYTTHLPQIFQQINDTSPPSFSGPKNTRSVGSVVRTLQNPSLSLSQKNPIEFPAPVRASCHPTIRLKADG